MKSSISINALLNRGYDKSPTQNIPYLNAIPKFVITGGKFAVPKVTVFLAKSYTRRHFV
jgi:hypothetical protein